jgi:chaperone BCS1
MSCAANLTSRNYAAWVMMWLSKQPAWTQAKELSISTRSFGVGAAAVTVEGEEDDNAQRKIRFFPSFGCSASLWYKGHYLHLTRHQVQDGPFYIKEILTMKYVFRRILCFIPRY